MKLTKERYIKKYVGNVNKRRTAKFKKSGKFSKNQRLSATSYNGIFKIKNGNDVNGYLCINCIHPGISIHNTKGKFDTSRINLNQKWETKKLTGKIPNIFKKLI